MISFHTIRSTHQVWYHGIISYAIISYLVPGTKYHFISSHATFGNVIPYHTIPYNIVSYHVFGILCCATRKQNDQCC